MMLAGSSSLDLISRGDLLRMLWPPAFLVCLGERLSTLFPVLFVGSSKDPGDALQPDRLFGELDGADTAGPHQRSQGHQQVAEHPRGADQPLVGAAPYPGQPAARRSRIEGNPRSG